MSEKVKVEMLSRLQLEEMIPYLLKRQFNVGFENYMVPLLIGPTQCGKTRLIRQLTDSLGYGLVVLLLQTSESTEITGMVKAIETGRNEYAIANLNPAWYNEYVEQRKKYGKVVLFLDEIDKAPTDCLAAILTMLRNKTINGVTMEDAALIAACNEFQMKDEWAPEMRARFRPLGVTYDWKWEIDHMDPIVKGLLQKRLEDTVLIKPLDTHNPKSGVTSGEVPTMWHNLARDIRDFGANMDILKSGLGMFHPAVKDFIVKYLETPDVQFDVDPSCIHKEQVRTTLIKLIATRKMDPELMATQYAAVLKYMFSGNVPTKDSPDYEEFTNICYTLIPEIAAAALQADIDLDRAESAVYVGALVKTLFDTMPAEMLAKVCVNVEKLRIFNTAEGKDPNTGVPYLRELYSTCEQIVKENEAAGK